MTVFILPMLFLVTQVTRGDNQMSQNRTYCVGNLVRTIEKLDDLGGQDPTVSLIMQVMLTYSYTYSF